MELTSKQVKAIVGLASGMTSVAVAKDVGTTPQTLCAWKNIPEFVVALNKIKQEILDCTYDRLRDSASIAVSGLIELATSAKSEAIRHKACLDLLSLIGVTTTRTDAYRQGIGVTGLLELEREREAEEFLNSF